MLMQVAHTHTQKEGKFVLFNDASYCWLLDINIWSLWHFLRGNLLSPHRLLFAISSKHFPTDRTAHTTPFDGPVVDHCLERKIAQTAKCTHHAGSIRWSQPLQLSALPAELRPAPLDIHIDIRACAVKQLCGHHGLRPIPPPRDRPLGKNQYTQNACSESNLPMSLARGLKQSEWSVCVCECVCARVCVLK